VYQRFTEPVEARAASTPSARTRPAIAQQFDMLKNRDLPLDATFTILVGSYPTASPRVSDEVRAITSWLESCGLPVYYAEADHGPGGRWHRVLAGAYADEPTARRELARLKAQDVTLEAQIVSASVATGTEPR
jgi:hypothetical protein